MGNPFSMEHADDGTKLGSVFGTSVVVIGKTWLPLTELITLCIMTRLAGKHHPNWPVSKHLSSGALSSLVILGSEWCHNFAHAAAANWVGKPMTALRITWGMPIVFYEDPEDRSVTPRQHILRSLGGPVFNAFLMLAARTLRRNIPQNTVARDAANAAVGMNTFLSTVSLLPIPGFDGGPILKWSLVECGQPKQKAEAIVKMVNAPLGAGLAAASVIAFNKKRRLFGVIAALFAVIAVGVTTGLLKE